MVISLVQCALGTGASRPVTTGMTAPGRPSARAPWLPSWQMRQASPTAVAPSNTFSHTLCYELFGPI